ncbi:MAG: hypothetical protein DRJ67_11915 [Thermoprotei archaeon]|nr:MAG: hypothetical protein DRJ67_11915 [Thermoprotei archaeon]
MDRILLAFSAVFLASATALFLELLSPSNVRIVLVGSSVKVLEIPGMYSRFDLAVTAASAFAAGVSASAILLRTQRRILQPKLEGSERRVYEFLVRRGGEVYQSEICEALGLSKSSVSEIVRRLELRGLVEVRREGLRNLVVLRREA